jgi:hypothetical protein
MDSVMFQSVHPESGFRGVFEDDGRAAYLYLANSSGVVADVWLYNHGPAPDLEEFSRKENLPFRNPREFISEETVVPVKDGRDLGFEWILDPGRVSLRLRIRGVLFATLSPGEKPGRSRLAVQDGPVAKVLK